MNHKQARWLALYVLCLGDLMIVLDTNIVNVALPSIQADLGFSQTALAWVVNAYMLTFGGFLLLSGRLGDLYGNRRVLLGGVAAFTVASVACAFAPNATLLVVGRAGIGLEIRHDVVSHFALLDRIRKGALAPMVQARRFGTVGLHERVELLETFVDGGFFEGAIEDVDDFVGSDHGTFPVDVSPRQPVQAPGREFDSPQT